MVNQARNEEVPNGNVNGTPAAISHTDRRRWRLRNDRGRQTWHYLQSEDAMKAWPMTCADKYYLGLDTVGTPCEAPGQWADGQ